MAFTLMILFTLPQLSVCTLNLKSLSSFFHPSAYEGVLWIRRGPVWQSYNLHIETGYCHFYASRWLPWIWTQGVGHEYFITSENFVINYFWKIYTAKCLFKHWYKWSLQCAVAVDNLATYYFNNITMGEAPTSPAAIRFAQHIADCPSLFPEVTHHCCLSDSLQHKN